MAITAFQDRRTSDSNAYTYQQRRDKLVPVLKQLGLRVNYPRAGLYVWAGVPAGWDGKSIASLLLDDKAILVTPGDGDGPGGDAYVRLALTLPDARLDEAVVRLSGWKIPTRAGN